MSTSTTDMVSNFYGKQVQKTEDLIFDACCVADYDLALLRPITDEVKARRYGCGSPIPPVLEGCTVLDLGCGAGIDCFIAAQLVGPTGKVIGVDMTPEQLEIAQRNVAPIMDNLGFKEPNVEFVEGRIEAIPVPDNSVDVVISNCVINLSEDKDKVFAEIHRVLKPGGEFYIADIVSDRRIPARLKKDELLYSECLSGAAYTGDLTRLMTRAGFQDVRTVRDRKLNDVIEGIYFSSVVLRGFKIDLEDQCEDYGQVAVYLGSVQDKKEVFDLDLGHAFTAGQAMRVCKNTADMIKQSRYASHFVVSEEIFHMGLFDCSPTASADTRENGHTPHNHKLKLLLKDIMRHIGLVTCAEMPALYPGEAPLLRVLHQANWETKAVVWDDPEVDWDQFDLVLVRNPWDYFLKPTAFFAWIARMKAQNIPLYNSADTLRRNADKRYLMDLGEQVHTIPTLHLESGSRAAYDQILAQSWDKVVLKPAISGGGRLTTKHEADQKQNIQQALEAIWAEGGAALAQRFMPEISQEGEVSLVFFGGRFSHAVRKVAAQGQFLIHEIYGGSVHPWSPPEETVQQAQAALQAWGQEVLYARVDGVLTDQGLCLMELELIEPELFFPYSEGAPKRLLQAIEAT